VVDVAIDPAVLEIVGTLATNGMHFQRCGVNVKEPWIARDGIG
jgi:hypothetical protein